MQISWSEKIAHLVYEFRLGQFLRLSPRRFCSEISYRRDDWRCCQAANSVALADTMSVESQKDWMACTRHTACFNGEECFHREH